MKWKSAPLMYFATQRDSTLESRWKVHASRDYTERIKLFIETDERGSTGDNKARKSFQFRSQSIRVESERDSQLQS